MITARWLPLLLVLASGCEWLDQGRMPCVASTDCFSGWSCGAPHADGLGRCEEGPASGGDPSFSYDYATFDMDLTIGELAPEGASTDLVLRVAYMDPSDATICTQEMRARGAAFFGPDVGDTTCPSCRGEFFMEQSTVEDRSDAQAGGCLPSSLDAVGENLGARLLSEDDAGAGGDLLDFRWMPQAAWVADDYSLDRAGDLFPEDVATSLEGQGVVLAGVLLMDCGDGSPLLCQRGLAEAATAVDGPGSAVSFGFALAMDDGTPTALPRLRGFYGGVGWWAIPPASR